jgi:phosphate transport system permease protein
MTDVAAPTSIPPRTPSSAAAARVKKRYGAERRFRAYGIGAVIFSALFIVILMSDVIGKAIPAFTQNSILLDIPLKAESIDPTGERKQDVLRAADYDGLVREVLRERFPYIKSRQERRDLAALLSTGAADELRARVVADPSIIGTTVQVPALLGSNPDLYVKGLVATHRTVAGRGSATPSATEGEVTLFSTANDFADVLLAVKNELRDQASAIRRERERIAANIQGASTDERARLQPELDKLDKQAQELQARYDAPARTEAINETFPSVHLSINGGMIRVSEIGGDRIKGTTIIPLGGTAEAPPGAWEVIAFDTAESVRKVNDRQIVWLDKLQAMNAIQGGFNWAFFTRGNSAEAELAGILGGIMGSLLTMAVTLALSLPIGVLAAIYLEEFAPKNRWTELVEVNINNLAAVPSIVFGLLGLAVFLNFFGMPRSAPIVGGIVIALMTLPTIIIAARAALRAVPPSIREAALGVGASRQQAVFHHVLPLAMPGIMTGTIIGMASALGETAPLILIGMVVFTTDVPTTLTQISNVLPVLVFSWADQPEAAFRAKTAAAIIVLLVFLFLMNGLAIWLRKRFERKW